MPTFIAKLAVAIVVVILPLIPDGASTARAQTKRECRQACQAQIDACILSCGDFGTQAQFVRSCKKAVIKRCQREGLATCQDQGASVTTTTLAPLLPPAGNFRSCFTSRAPLCGGPCPDPGQLCQEVGGACLCVATPALPGSTTTSTSSSTTTTTLLGPGACFDGVRNGDEVDVDCGGPTCERRCAFGQFCAQDSDCEATFVCLNKLCQ